MTCHKELVFERLELLADCGTGDLGTPAIPPGLNPSQGGARRHRLQSLSVILHSEDLCIPSREFWSQR